MSLVAYDASSGEESENDDETSSTQVILLNPKANNRQPPQSKPVESTKNGHISDDDDDFVPQEVPLQQLKSGRLALLLPKPKIASEPALLQTEDEQIDEQVTSAIAKLPKPRTTPAAKPIIEEDDEYLHKKVKSIALEKPPPPPVKARVKISIPSLKDFSDVDKEKAEKLKKGDAKTIIPKGSGLLSILPQAKSERDFSKRPAEIASTDAPTLTKVTAPRAVPAFVPDTVKQRRAAHNTESVDGLKAPGNKKSVAPVAIVNASDSEDDDESGAGDFFSLHSDQQLPEVSTKEINALVDKRAAKMVETSNKYLKEEAAQQEAEAERLRVEEEELRLAQKRYHERQLNNEAMDALVGKSAKRRRKEAQDMHIIDISGTEVLPDREEWMRTALTSSTSFQATGVLNDEEPVAGTRRKHQITYLAHKAKANEAELQAMWSANRQNRRATQSKYGF